MQSADHGQRQRTLAVQNFIDAAALANDRLEIFDVIQSYIETSDRGREGSSVTHEKCAGNGCPRTVGESTAGEAPVAELLTCGYVLPIMQYMKAIRVFYKKEVRPDDVIVEAVIWRLPEPSPERPHGFKYRFYCGKNGQCLVRYDNETGKGDHRHYGDMEESYVFSSLSALVDDFERDVQRLTGEPHD